MPFLIPIFYFGLLLAIRPADRLSPSEQAGPLRRLVYDDYDVACYALRGLNATVARRPFGRINEVPYEPPPEAGQPDPLSLRLDHWPPADLASRYFLEYPPPALWLFRLGYELQRKPGPVPASLLDADYHALVYHQPRDATERGLWRQFRFATDVYAGLMLACLIGLMLVLRRGYEPGARLAGPVLLLLLPGALFFTANRFDVLPALLVALAYACLGRRRIVAAAVFLGAATAFKVYAILLVPLVAAYLWPRRKAIAAFAAAYGLTMVALLLPWLIQFGWEATAGPFRYQLGRTYEPFSGSFYDGILPQGLAGATLLARLFRLGMVILAVGWFLWRRPTTMPALLRASAAVLLVFVGLQVFYSPQWLLWLSPLLLPLAASDRRIFWLYIALDLVNYWSFAIYTWTVPETIWPRFLVWLSLLGVLVWAALRRPHQSGTPLSGLAPASKVGSIL